MPPPRRYALQFLIIFACAVSLGSLILGTVPVPRYLPVVSHVSSRNVSVGLADCRLLISWSPAKPWRPAWAGQTNRFGFRYNRYSDGSANYWIPLVLFTVPGLIVLALARRALYRSRQQGETICTTCGYDLRAHHPGARCPECGIIPSQLPPGTPPLIPWRIVLVAPPVLLVLLWIRSHLAHDQFSTTSAEAPGSLQLMEGRIVLLRLRWVIPPPVEAHVLWTRYYVLSLRDPTPQIHPPLPNLPPPSIRNMFGFGAAAQTILASRSMPYAFKVQSLVIPYWLPTILAALPLAVHAARRAAAHAPQSC